MYPSRDPDYRRVYNKKHFQEVGLNKQRRCRARKRSAGLCHDCSSPVVLGKNVCQKCYDRSIKSSTARYERLIKDGLCPQCGKNPPDFGKVHCVKCRDRATQLNKARLFHYRATKFNWTFKTDLTAKDLALKWKKQRGFCALTGRRLTRLNAEVDHRIPKIKGGTHDITNLRWVVKDVNRLKRDMLDDEFFLLCKQVVSWIERENRGV